LRGEDPGADDIETPQPENATPTSAKALALGLITRALATQGEDGSPRVVVCEGPDAGKSLDVHDVTRRYVMGRAPDVDLVLEDETAARRHIEFGVKGDSLVVKDLGSTTANLEGSPLGQTDSPWRMGQTVRIGKNVLAFEYPAAVALAELSRGAFRGFPMQRPWKLLQRNPAKKRGEDKALRPKSVLGANEHEGLPTRGVLRPRGSEDLRPRSDSRRPSP